ncbi:MAG TPA: hypothetical protein VKV15_13380 [Bryobacteraceae bacterium]|nr:hypothetical protein [Bryobacteraceae bacterium]
MPRTLILIAVCCAAASGTIIDRSAILVGTRVIKDSDIRHDIRITAFLNRETPDFSLASKRKAASRLIDQELIRTQIQSGDYPVAPESEAVQLLERIKKERFSNDAQYRSALARYGITEPELKQALEWQLTVLRFIDERFRPAVFVTDEEIQNYYKAHRAALERADPKAKSLNDLRPKIEQLITGEQVNKMFEEWLDRARRDARVQYREESLQ